ncbi:DUF2254 family protein [Streptomyces sp. NPDC057271]|uniref:DUF2254 family protein n=1 Tax=unclassified Streptomyces TaxID=2593676 RepID=UPI00362DF044
MAPLVPGPAAEGGSGGLHGDVRAFSLDIAVRALCPAVNHPTTAVRVIDYVGSGRCSTVCSTPCRRDNTARCRSS